MVPLTSPSRARNASSLWASTSTMALPMPTTSMLACVIWLAKTPQGNPAATIAASSVPTRSETAISGSRTPEGIREGVRFECEEQQRSAGDAVNLPGRESAHLGVLGKIGVDQQLPMPAADRFRQGEPDEIVVAVQHHQEGGVFAAPADAGRLGAAVHQHAKTFHAHVAPFLGFTLRARGVEPG